MTEQAKDYIERYEITYSPKDDFYHYGELIRDEDEIEIMAKYDLDPDTEINVEALDANDSIDYISGFDNGLHQLYYYMQKVINDAGLDHEQRRFLKSKMGIFEMDYQDFQEKILAEIGNKMECHEASLHFEDYMNEPESQMSDIEICRNNHPQRNGDCAFCTEVCCPQSSVNEV